MDSAAEGPAGVRTEGLRPGPRVAQPDLGHRVLGATQLAILGAAIWIRDQSAFTVLSAVRFDGVPDWRRLVESGTATLGRHDIFGWRPYLDDGHRPVASAVVPAPGTAFMVEEVDLRAVHTAAADAAVHRRLTEERRRVIDVFRAEHRPYTRMVFFRLGHAGSKGETGVGALVTHHLFVDERSVDLLWNEVFRRAAGRAHGEDYERGYADWTMADAGAAARARARHAAEEITDQLLAGPLGSLSAAPRPGAGDGVGSPVRFTIPAATGAAAARRAKDLAVPPSTFYAAALVHVLCARASYPRLAVSVPMTRRRDIADIDVVGCYVNTVPVLAESGGTSAEAVVRWHRSVAFSSDRAHADVDTVRARLGQAAQVALFFESRSGRRTAKPITWSTLPPPDSSAKAPVAVFLAPGSGRENGDGRLLWQDGVFTVDSALALIEEYLHTLTRFVGADDGGRLDG